MFNRQPCRRAAIYRTIEVATHARQRCRERAGVVFPRPKTPPNPPPAVHNVRGVHPSYPRDMFALQPAMFFSFAGDSGV